MKTEITKTYKSGFVLTEQELRRIIQASTEHAEKVSGGQEFSLGLVATLKDGSIIEFDKTDDLFSLENAGAKKVQKVSIKLASLDINVPWEISVLFQDGALNQKDWTSISLQITGSSRDWAFVTASDLEDRIKRTKAISFEALFSSKFTIMWVMMLSVVTMSILTSQFTPGKKSHVLLQQQYSAGQLHDPIQALIALERIKNERTVISELLPLLIGFGAPFLGIVLISFVAPRLSPSYNFCWGDYVAYYERRKQIQMIFWTVIVLGLIVAIAANFFSKKLGL
jgi:hypothetical protein